MPRRITILVNDDGTSQVESDVAVEATSTPTPTTQSSDPLTVLKEQFVAALGRNKKAAFAALGYNKCSEVPEAEIAAKTEALRAVVKVKKS